MMRSWISTSVLVLYLAGTSAFAQTDSQTDPAVVLSEFQELQRIAAVRSFLGSLIGSKEACGFDVDDIAVSSFVTKEVPPEQIDFAAGLAGETTIWKSMVMNMDTTALAAHCTALRNSADNADLIK